MLDSPLTRMPTFARCVFVSHTTFDFSAYYSFCWPFCSSLLLSCLRSFRHRTTTSSTPMNRNPLPLHILYNPNLPLRCLNQNPFEQWTGPSPDWALRIHRHQEGAYPNQDCLNMGRYSSRTWIREQIWNSLQFDIVIRIRASCCLCWSWCHLDLTLCWKNLGLV